MSDIRARLDPPWPSNVMYVPALTSQLRLKSQLMAGLNAAFVAALSVTLTVQTDTLSSAVRPGVHRRDAAPVWFYDPRPTEALLTLLNR